MTGEDAWQDWAERYWEKLLPVGTAPVIVTAVPKPDDALDLRTLQSLVSDPLGSIRGATNLSVYRRFELLNTVARYLDALPPTTVPEILRSRAARLRFLIWSLPARLRAAVPGVDIEDDPDHALLRARAARHDWQQQLRAWQDDPWLTQRHQQNPRDFERELRLLTHSWPDDIAPPHANVTSRALILAGTDASAEDNAFDHDQVARDLVETHWLPRGSVTAGLRAFQPGRRPIGRVLTLTAPVLVLMAPLVLVALRRPDTARWMALAELGVGLCTVILLPAWRDGLLVLRLPAAAGAGSLVLLSFTSRWWLDPDSWRVGAGLAVLAFLYLVLETRLHGVRRRDALSRGALVWAAGVLYAATISIVVLGFVAPSVADHGQCLLGWWTENPFTAHKLPDKCGKEFDTQVGAAPAGVLVLMTGWSLAVGLLAQVLWDDRPVTAPLGRLKRTRGAP